MNEFYKYLFKRKRYFLFLLKRINKMTGNWLDRIIVVGDRVLIKPKSEDSKTPGGLFLPPGYEEKEVVQSGYVVKTGPGYPIPMPGEEPDEPWKPKKEPVNYIPLQAQPGDLAVFLKKGAIEIHFHDIKYYIVSQYSILLLERDEEEIN